jgi:hypothetical protein
LRREERRTGVQIECLVEMGFGDVLEADRLDKAATGYQNVELALFLADRLKKAIKVGSDGSTSLE